MVQENFADSLAIDEFIPNASCLALLDPLVVFHS